MPYKIVVADPSPSVQKIVQLAFPEPEFRLFPFENGVALLDAVDELRPDAVLLSPSIPGRDGCEVARILRAREAFRNVPLLFLKGAFEPLEPERLAGCGCDEVVQKPFDSERLAASVRELIARKTGPSSLPEEPVWLPAGGKPAGTSAGADRRPGPGTDQPAGSAAAAPEGGRAEGQAQPDPALQDWVRREIVGMERELEKRLRARLLAEIEARTSGPPRRTDS